jgi:hypothetical protein
MSEDEYRHYAIECLLLARELRDAAHKAGLLAMVDARMALADEAAVTSAHSALGRKSAPEGEEGCLKRRAHSGLPPLARTRDRGIVIAAGSRKRTQDQGMNTSC